jgi:probable F420-dependent oxidoreductase
MRFGLFLMPLTAEVETTRDIVVRADEDPRIHSIWFAEPHLLAFAEVNSVFPYTEDGKMPDDYTVDGELDGMLGLAFAAALTKRARLGIGICVVPQHQPVTVAKAVTTLDVLSGGRFDFGVGIGWLEEEFRSVGASFEGRAARTSSHLEVMRTLWSESGEGVEDLPSEIAGAVQEPYPIQQPHPPIYFGGNSKPAMRRVASLGQGWLPWELAPEEATEKIAALTELLSEGGRERSEITVSVATEAPLAEIDFAAYAASGIDQLVIVVQPKSSREEVDQLFDRIDSGLVAVAAAG